MGPLRVSFTIKELPLLYSCRNYVINVAGAKSGNNEFEREYQICHLPTTPVQKYLLGFGSAIVSLSNPRRGDMIAAMGETVGTKSIEYVRNKMLDSEEGTRILTEKPRINSTTVDIEKLGLLEENTVGKTYYNFLKHYGYTPDARLAVRFIDDIELAYVVQRYREVHDLFHTILKMPTNMLGEVAVKWVEGIQTRLPMCVGGALFGAARLAPKCTRSYSTKRFLLDEQLETSQKITDENYKAGVLKKQHNQIPDSIQKIIISMIKDRKLSNLEEGGIKLTNYLLSRKLPFEELEKRTLKKEYYSEVFDTLALAEIVPSNLDEEEYIREVAAKNVENLMKSRMYKWKALKMDDVLSYFYLSSRTAAEYAVVTQVFSEILRKDANFVPKSLFDFGSGIGTVSWAANFFWGSSISEYYTVDSSPEVNDLALLILQSNNPTNSPFIKNFYQRQFLPATPRPYDLVVSAYSLFELNSCNARLNVVSNLWSKTNSYLVLIEQGTNSGFQALLEARDFILHISKAKKIPVHIVAPCPHDFHCPRLSLNDGTPCNFMVKYKPLLPDKTNQFAREKFFYVILKKGERDNSDPQYPRIIREVVRRHKHTICRLCTKAGKLEEVVVTASKYGKSAYKCSKKSSWGNVFSQPLVKKQEGS